MNEYVSDTMALILRLEKRKMPLQVKHIFEQAEQGLAKIYIPTIVFAELAYLSEKKRIDTSLNEAEVYLKKRKFIKELPLSLAIVKSAFSINDIPELHDRLIAACGKYRKCPIISNDPDMESSRHVQIVWG